MKTVMKSIFSIIFGAIFLIGCSSGDGNGADGKVNLELFSNKTEAIETYRGLIEEFEEQNPDITIKLETPPEAETVLKTRLAKNDIPDILFIGGNATYGELAEAGVFHDFTDSDLLNEVQPSYIEMINKLVGQDEDATYAIPYATNANAVMYNKQKLDELGLDVPETWDDFIAALDTAKEAGEVPIYFTLKDAWTGMVLWNSLGGNLVGDDFAEKKTNGETTFVESYDEVADKALTLIDYGQKDVFGIGYDDGNKAFANGESVFYIQGNWAIPEILNANPDMDLGIFAMPVTNDPSKNNLVSGVDVLATINDDTKHKEEALKFLEFMTDKDIAKRYIDEQKAFSAFKGILQEDPAFEGVQESFEEGKLASFPDHYYPAGMQAENLIQEFYIEKDKEAGLEKLDKEWDKVVNR